jgi:NhaA family Na+:H+ antiporter
MVGVGVLAGIGFTVAIFIATLAFEATPLLAGAKVGVLGASVISGVAGYLVLRICARLWPPQLGQGVV